MRVCLVFPLVGPCESIISRPLGIFLLRETLNKRAIGVDIIIPRIDPHAMSLYSNRNELTRKDKEQIVRRELSKDSKLINSIHNADVLGVSCDSFNYAVGRQVIRLAKTINKDIKAIIGGVHGSILDEYVIRTSGADIVVRGEGEDALIQVLQCMESNMSYRDVPGVTYFTGNGNIERNPDRVCQTVEQMMEYGRVHFDAAISNGYGYIPIETARGCPYNCTFCSVLHKNSWRAFSFEYITERILDVAYPTSKIFFVDDSFTIDIERAVSILRFVQDCDAISKIQCEARVNNLTDRRILESISPEKVGAFQIGVESGYPEGLKKIRKRITIQQVEEVCRLAHDRGMGPKMSASFIIGFPWEGTAECLKTVEFCALLKEKYDIMTAINWWIPSPSEIWYEIKNEVGLDESMYDEVMWSISKNIFYRIRPSISEKDVAKLNYLMLNAAHNIPMMV